jgi:hypothetical protein
MAWKDISLLIILVERRNTLQAMIAGYTGPPSSAVSLKSIARIQGLKSLPLSCDDSAGGILIPSNAYGIGINLTSLPFLVSAFQYLNRGTLSPSSRHDPDSLAAEIRFPDLFSTFAAFVELSPAGWVLLTPPAR